MYEIINYQYVLIVTKELDDIVRKITPQYEDFVYNHPPSNHNAYKNRSITINSGVRCEHHNYYIAATPTSSHIDGWAADLGYTGSAARYELLNAAFQVFDRIGIAKTFIHVDVDATKTAGVVWLYS